MSDLRAVTEIGEMEVGDKLLLYDMNQLIVHTITSLDGDTVIVDDLYDIEPNDYGQWVYKLKMKKINPNGYSYKIGRDSAHKT